MATARKRGKKWRCLAYVGTVDGKRKYKSFTADGKREAERLAAEYEAAQEEKPLTVKGAVDAYIKTKESVLSPSTIRAYKEYAKLIPETSLDAFGDMEAQAFVAQLVKDGKSPKYIRNVFGLLSSSVRLQRPQKPISATLPQKTRKLSYTPTNAEIQAILPLYDEEMQIAIMLAAYCSLRCGEICALTSEDLNGKLLTVNKAYARTSSGEYVLKAPKTAESRRTMTVPSFLLDKLRQIKGRYVQRTPQGVSLAFAKVAKKNGVPFRFHDLRHFFASELAKTQPLAVIERMGGWSPGSPVLRQIYIGAQEAEMRKRMEAATAVFEDMQPEMQPSKEKSP